MSEEDILDEGPGEEVEALLPDGYEYIILEIKPICDNGFEGLFRIALKSREEILMWLEEYQQRNHLTFIEVALDEKNLLKTEFTKLYRCVVGSTPTSKNDTQSTQCDATIKTTLKKENMKNIADKYIKTHPCEIFITHNHNHALSFSITQFQDWFELLFQEGHSPKSALLKIQEELQQEHGENYLEAVPSGKICLCDSWVNEFYLTLYEEPYEEPLQEEYSELEITIHEYNDKCGDVCAMVKDPSTIAICSPLMKRNWQLIPEVEEVIYVDSSVLDKHNMRIMLFSCQSRLGILPLGILLFPCEDEDGEFIIEGIKLLKLMLPENAKTPKLMIVADTNEEKCNLLKNCFDIENVLISKIFVQKVVMKWLWNHKNRINKGERINIYVTFIKTLNSSNKDEFEASYENLQKLTIKNKKTFNFFENLTETAPLWATCYRQNQKYDTNEYSKTIFKVLDNMPDKTLNNVQLFACVASNFENYFFNWLTKLSTCDGLTTEHMESWQGCSSSVFDCRQIGDNLYSVMEDMKINIVNRSIDYCTCSVDQNMVPCRHKWAIISAFNFKDDLYPLVDEELKQLIKKLLMDNECILEGWYDDDDNKERDQLNSDDKNTEKISNDVDPHTEEIQNKLENTVKTIVEKLKSNPTVFTEPVEKFISGFENCKTDDDLVNALESFGKPKVTAMADEIQKSVVKRSRNKSTKQNSAGNSVFKELQGADLAKKNKLNNNNTNGNGPPVKRSKRFNTRSQI